MMARFGGALVEEQTPAGGRFGGVAIEPEEKGFTERVEERFAGRRQEVVETFEDYGKGEIGFPQAAVQVLGKAGFGGTLDVIGEGLVSTGRTISDLTPDSIETPIVESATEAWNWLSETGAGELAGQALEGGMNRWDEFSKEYPQAAKTVESIANIGLLLAPAKVKAKTEPSILGKVSADIGKSAGKQIARRRAGFVDDLISPKKTPTIKIAETARTTEEGMGLLKKSVVELSKREKEISAEVSRINSVTPKNSIQGNLNAIVQANREMAKKLEKDVAKGVKIRGVGQREMPVVSREVSSAINKSIDDIISKTPLIVGDVERSVNKVRQIGLEFMSKNKKTPSGLLKTRKEFDSWARRLPGGEKALSSDAATAQSQAIHAVRNAMNDIINAKVKNAAVKSELKRQSLLFDAIENLGVKAADESNYAIGRIIQNTAKILPFRSKFVNEVGTILGLGIVSSSALLSPIFATGLVTAVASKGAYNLVISPTAKKGLAKLIKTVDRAINTSTNPSMIKQLRADRAMVLELMKTAEVDDE